MPRIEVPAPADFSANTLVAEPLPSITNMLLWAYLRESLAASPNMVDDSLLTVVGAPEWDATSVLLTPGVNHLIPTGVLDSADATLMVVGSTEQIGGNFSPLFSAYVAAAGLMVALGDNEIRFHASGFGAITTLSVPASIGHDPSFWSFQMDSGGSTPLKWKNWTHGYNGTFGTPSANRSSTGTQCYIGGQTAAPTILYPSRQWFVAYAGKTLSDAEVESCYLAVQSELAVDGVPV